MSTLTLYIPTNYDFIMSNVFAFSRRSSSLLMQSFIAFLLHGYPADFLDHLSDIVSDLEDDTFFYNELQSDDPLLQDIESIKQVDLLGHPIPDTVFYMQLSDSELATKRLLLRALALSFWGYLRETVFNGKYDLSVKLDNPALNWVNHLDDDSFETFLAQDFDADWFIEHMDDACWLHDMIPWPCVK